MVQTLCEGIVLKHGTNKSLGASSASQLCHHQHIPPVIRSDALVPQQLHHEGRSDNTTGTLKWFSIDRKIDLTWRCNCTRGVRRKPWLTFLVSNAKKLNKQYRFTPQKASFLGDLACQKGKNNLNGSRVRLKILLKGVNLTTFKVKIHNVCVLISEVSSSNSNTSDVFMRRDLWALFVSEATQLCSDQYPINRPAH